MIKIKKGEKYMMPIDFNTHFILFNSNKPIQQKVAHNHIIKKNPTQDTFEKNVKISATDINDDFAGMKIEQKSFGKLKSGEETTLYTITNKNGASVDLSTFGATIVSIKVPDKNGKLTDVTQGYSNVTPYEQSPIGHAGGTIGPCANKINNGKFTLNGKEYSLECNKDNGKTHSHGGSKGFDVKNWHAEIIKEGIKFTYNKKDGENGYPANVTASVTYKFNNDNELLIHYEATSDKTTVINMTNHTYFNLDGAENTKENSVIDHIVELPNSSKYTVNNEIAIPTGEIASVKNTPFDFTEEKAIKDAINEDFEQIKIGHGIDQNFCIDGYDGKKLIEVAEITSPKTGIQLTVSTNLPGFQFYTANHLGKDTQPLGKNGTKYEKRSAFCVEPQFYPDAINTFKEKPILNAGEKYSRDIVYEFDIEDED